MIASRRVTIEPARASAFGRLRAAQHAKTFGRYGRAEEDRRAEPHAQQQQAESSEESSHSHNSFRRPSAAINLITGGSIVGCSISRGSGTLVSQDKRAIKLRLIIFEIERHENLAAEPPELFFRRQVHLSRGAGPADLQMVKRNRRLNHRLKKKFFIRRDRSHPTFFPRIVGRVKLAGVVQIDAGQILDRISEYVLLSVGRRQSFASLTL